MNTKVSWLNNKMLVASSASGHSITMDGAPEIGGQNLAPRPTELVLMAFGGCTSMDILVFLEKNQQNFTSCEVEILSERADTHPKVFTKIHLIYNVTGYNLDKNLILKGIKLSKEKYCSVSSMLEKSTIITYEVKINNK